MQPVIQMNNVSKRFGNTVALQDVSLAVPPGTVCALLGANGAGKSTAIRILLGLEHPDAGFTEVLGMNSQTHPLEIRRRIGYVSDQPPLYDWMTVEEIGWFASGFYPTGYNEAFSRLIAGFDLPPGSRIATLSKGMRAKVALSLSLAHRPDLLILDEPTSGLDPLVRREFLESMVDVAAEGRSVLLSSHQVSEVERVADSVVILLNGRIACIERLDDLKSGTTEVTLVLKDDQATPPQVPGSVLAHVQFCHEHLFMVRDLDFDQLNNQFRQAGIAPPQVRKPNLEDILLAMLREYRRSAPRERRETTAPKTAASAAMDPGDSGDT